MDYVILTLGLPLAALAVAAVHHWQRMPPAVGAAPELRFLAAHKPGAAVALMGWLRQRLFPWLRVLVFVAGILLVLNIVRGGPNAIKLIMLSRYGLLAGLLLVGLVPLALLGAPSLLGSIFVLRKPSQLFNVCWISVLVAAMSVVTTLVVEWNARERYGTEKLAASAGPWGTYRILIILVLRSCPRITS